MTYSEKRELESIEGKILALEEEVSEFQIQAQDPLVLSNPSQLQEVCQQLDQKQKQLDDLYHRWQELENKNG